MKRIDEDDLGPKQRAYNSPISTLVTNLELDDLVLAIDPKSFELGSIKSFTAFIAREQIYKRLSRFRGKGQILKPALFSYVNSI